MTHPAFSSIGWLPGALVLLAACAGAAGEVEQLFLAEGVTRRIGGYRPIRAPMDQEAGIVRVAPEGLVRPAYGLLTLGDSSWAFVIDQPEEGPGRLWVDTNADGDLTNDPATTWEPKQHGDSTTYSGTATINLGDGNVGSIGVYRFDPNDPRRAQLANVLLWYVDFGHEYAFEIDGEKLTTFTAGTPDAEATLPIDRNGDGDISRNYEVATIGKPFNFTGSTMVFSLEDGRLTLAKAAEELPRRPLPPDLRLGQPVPAFTATDLDGDSIEFPEHYAGKIVMLYFWATWCGPCIAEIPNVKRDYDDWHDAGFEILGVSLDGDDDEEKVRQFLVDRELPWKQIHDGRGRPASLAQQYDVSGIPFVLLVDGDSGKIIGTSRDLRGPKLTAFVGAALEAKHTPAP
jgi:peroxiredoxin